MRYLITKVCIILFSNILSKEYFIKIIISVETTKENNSDSLPLITIYEIQNVQEQCESHSYRRV